MTVTIFLILYFFITLVEMAIPYLVKPTIVFGVSVPEKKMRDPRLLKFKRRYSLTVLATSLVLFIGLLVWGIQGNSTEETLILITTAAPFALLFVSLACYVYFHAKTTQLKREEKWGEGVKQLQITDLSVRSRDEMLPWYLFALPMLVTLGIIAYTIVHYQQLPNQIPTHWGPNGQPDAFTEKNPFSAISSPIMLFIMQVMFLVINETTKRSGIKLSATSTEASRVRQLTLRKYTSWFMFLTSILITMLFSFLQLMTVHENLLSEVMMLLIPFAFLLILLLGSIVFAVKVGKAGADKWVQSGDGVGDFDEDQYWKGGLFYFNKNDPSIFVEKRFGVGWTLNFANPIGYFITFGPILLILIVTYFT